MRRIGVLAGLVSTMLVAVLVACSSNPSQPSPSSGSIVVFAAASLKRAFTQVSQQFKTDNPGNGV
ncbi:MAG TPA: molybdate-binding protein, partial [Mycobacterium sp.]|nr:molybdate-binding protein [Mycobacterium sp.]